MDGAPAFRSDVALRPPFSAGRCAAARHAAQAAANLARQRVSSSSATSASSSAGREESASLAVTTLLSRFVFKSDKASYQETIDELERPLPAVSFETAEEAAEREKSLQIFQEAAQGQTGTPLEEALPPRPQGTLSPSPLWRCAAAQ